MTQNDDATVATPSQGIWARGRRRVARVVTQLATTAKPYASSNAWPVWAMLIGTVPFLVSYAGGVSGHQLASAVLLSLLCLGFVAEDHWMQCITAIALAFIAHSLLVVAMSRYDSERCAAILPKAADYWEQQRTWITTGVNQEYELETWLPAHGQMFVGISLFSFTSFGALVFHDGFVQVDMMNYYNAQLTEISQNQVVAVGLGWHLWSMMRGLGYLFVTYEMISLAYRVFANQINSTRFRRRLRWGLGVGFLMADCIIKFFAVDAVRVHLFENLS